MPFVPKTQPNGWSCLPTSFSMVMGVPLSRVLETIGHDGSAVQYPQFESPDCRRGFHVQECIGAAYRLGFNFGFFEAVPILVGKAEVALEIPDADTLEMLVRQHTGVLGVTTAKGYHHAVAWDGKDAYDPTLGARFPVDRYTIVMFCPLFSSRVESSGNNFQK